MNTTNNYNTTIHLWPKGHAAWVSIFLIVCVCCTYSYLRLLAEKRHEVKVSTVEKAP